MENTENNIVTDIDGNDYNLVQIKTQIWTKENLNVSKYRNGDEIPQVQDNAEWAALTTGAWCHLDNNPDNEAIYGKLYNFYAVKDPRGLAPEGFHIPIDDEIKKLITSFYNENNVGKNMKEEGTAHWRDCFKPADNETGFTALPGDLRCSDGEFRYQKTKKEFGSEGYWWCSYEEDCMPTESFDGLDAFTLSAYSDLCLRDHSIHGNDGLSVRCIKD